MKKFNKVIYLIMIFYLVIFGFKTVVLAAGNELNCDSWGEVLVDIQNVFNFLKVAVPLIIICLSTYDFVKAVAGKDNKDVKKAFQRLMKRFLYALILFFLPIIINYILYLVGMNSSVCIKG